MRRQGRQNRRQRRLTSAKTRKTSKPIAEIPVQEAYLNPTGNYLVQKDWMVAEAVERNWSPKFNNREFFENFRSKQAFGEE